MFPTILRGLGIKVDDETAKMLEATLPQLPAKANELIHYVLRRTDEFDSRLLTIELELSIIGEKLDIIGEKLEVASHGIDISDGVPSGTTNGSANNGYTED